MDKKKPLFSQDNTNRKQNKTFIQVNKVKVNPWLLLLLGVRLGANCSCLFYVNPQVEVYR